ncbi:hypothetical protein AURDEDRAFT_178372 [Auricularia subglabra TFB-10046 SS5]|uniref:Uncharacterized protein n=1 Tax=Auricularia subglabra (strain TFB-10046 / SS5) TaxID=717982 RepID=J0WLA2_AURST|nr:hypothetical protein AURDEDRAFT_178372 [Auricularia subglabra TFB-10046 SS5]
MSNLTALHPESGRSAAYMAQFTLGLEKARNILFIGTYYRRYGVCAAVMSTELDAV